MGEDLTNAETYTVVGFGFGFPNNFTPHTYEHVVFPSMPRRAQDCVACHGEDNEAYLLPGDRDHPTEQTLPVREWDTCLTCHDSDAAIAHADTQTSSFGVQACEICHGTDETESVDTVHKIRDN